MDYANSSCSRTRSGLVRGNINVGSNEGSCSRTQSGLVRGNGIVDSNVGGCSKTRSGLVRRNSIVDSNEGSCSKTRSGLVRGNAIVDSNEGSCSKIRNRLVRGDATVDLNEGSPSKTRSGLIRGNAIVDSNECSFSKTRNRGDNTVDLNEGSPSKTRSGIVRGNTIVAASNESCSRTRSGLVRGNIVVDSKEGLLSRTQSRLIRGIIEIDSSESSCSRTRSGLIRGSPSIKAQAKIEPVMNGLSDGCLKEGSPEKNEPNHKSNLVQSKDKPVMKGPDGWWKEDRLIKKGVSTVQHVPPKEVHGRDELGVKGLLDGCSKEDWKRAPNNKNDLVENKDKLGINGLPDGWWKEDRPRKNGSDKRTDPYYIDPVSGYEFRSLKDVQRFLKSGDIYQCSVRPKKRSIQDPRTRESQSHATSLQLTRPNTADKAIQCELLTSEGVMLPLEEQLSPYKGLGTKNKMPQLEGRIAKQRYANKVDDLKSKSITPVSAQNAARRNKSVTRKRKEPDAEFKPKKHKMNPAKVFAMPLRASPCLASLKITHDLNTKPEDEPTRENLVDEVQMIKENSTDQSRSNQAANAVQIQAIQESIVNQLQSSQTDAANHIQIMQEDSADQSQLSQANTMNQIQTDQQNAVSQLQSSQGGCFIQIQTIKEDNTEHSRSKLNNVAPVNQIQTNQGNTVGQLQYSQTDTQDQIQADQENPVSQLQSSQADSFIQIHTVQDYIVDHFQPQLGHANQMQINLGNTADQLQSSQADDILQMQVTQEYITNQFPPRQADTVNCMQISEDNTANLPQLRQTGAVNKTQTMQESATNQPQFIQVLTVNPIQTNEENTANYLLPNYAENHSLQTGFSLAPEPGDEEPVTSFWENVENQESQISMQIDGKPVASSALNVGCRDATAAPAQPAPAQPSGLALPSLFGNSWSDPCIEFAFKTLKGDIPDLDDEYFPHQQDLNEPPSPNRSASPSCFASSFGNSQNHTQADNVSLPPPKPSDKPCHGVGWFPPK
ncbi:hypothetical protein GUJ93_ZPchr0008g13152 [Zizania palustris]|uniref:MBD domain-containing protein n=1 Tax=Zizania palustris TaxID=103762 RepID=A0A8J5RW68_ZIZPA|nr:hypothetical protein GUJ93_ZPchr0008g13152 [Zizania palustris]